MNLNIPDEALLRFRKALKAGEKRWARWFSEAVEKERDKKIRQSTGKR